MVKNPLANARDAGGSGLIPESGRFPGEGNSNLLQHACLENSMDRGAWWAIVHGRGDQSWVFTGRTDVEAETPILWPPNANG